MIRLLGVTKRYGGRVAVGDLSLDVARGEVAVLIGPSGCGKTTTMRMVNRLVEPDAGRILLGGEDVTRADAVELRRRVGYVIQSVGLFPHQDVLTNVTTVPRLLGWNRDRAAARARELLALVGLEPADFAGRYPHQLSGGQRQRVGVARALAADPPALLMDEPFGAVDPIARGRLQEEFRGLQRELGTTVVLVTHDVDEALSLGDRIAVMGVGGRIEQYADPATLVSNPASDAVAGFIGADRTLRRLRVVSVDAAELVDAAQIEGWRLLVGAASSTWTSDAGREVEVPSLRAGTSLEAALAAILRVAAVPGLPVVDADGSCRGVLTATSALDAARGPRS